MTKEQLLDICKLLDYGLTVNENNKHWYEDAIAAGYVEVRKPKRATRFFLTEAGKKAIQPVLYLYLYRKFYFTRDTELTEEMYESYRNKHLDLSAWDLLIQYHKDKVNQYDGNKTMRPPRTYIYYIANLYRLSDRPEEAAKYYLLVCILDLSGIMEITTFESMQDIEDAYKPGGMFYKTRYDILNKSVLAPGIIAELKETLPDTAALSELFNSVYDHLNLPVSVRTREEILRTIQDNIGQHP